VNSRAEALLKAEEFKLLSQEFVKRADDRWLFLVIATNKNRSEYTNILIVVFAG